VLHPTNGVSADVIEFQIRVLLRQVGSTLCSCVIQHIQCTTVCPNEQGGKEENMVKAIKEMDLPNAVAQHYLPKPLLVNGFKFDMRIYALVGECLIGNSSASVPSVHVGCVHESD
jgi:hypothetical protein